MTQKERNEQIRQEYMKDPTIKLREIGAKYGLTKGRVWQIINRYDTNSKRFERRA